MPSPARTTATVLTLVGLLGSMAVAVNRPGLSSPVKSYVQDIQVGDGTSYRNLTIFPVTLHRAGASGVELMDESLRSQQLVVREIGEGRVNSLSVENVGKTPIFIMAGEILEGAKQNRVLQNDVLLPPHSGRLDIGAFCVEHGRWTHQEPNTSFKSGGLVTNPAVRAEAQAAKSQGAVWDEVARTNRGVDAPTHTGALNEAYAAPKVQEDMSGFVAAFQDMPRKHPDMVGSVVMLGQRILAADCFGDHTVEVGLWPKLIRSYALQAESDHDGPGAGTGTEARAEANDFLARVFDASTETETSPGAGQLLDIHGSHCSGSVLIDQNWPLHLALFPHNESSSDGYDMATPPVPAIERPYPR